MVSEVLGGHLAVSDAKNKNKFQQQYTGGAMADPYIGEIRIFAGNYAPQNWAFCQGQLLSIDENDVLFSLIGTTYGGDGQTTFALPNLAGRIPLHQGSGPGLSTRIIGELGGAEAISLNPGQLPIHSHNALCQDSAGDQVNPVGHFWSKDGSNNTAPYQTDANSLMASSAIANGGQGQAHENLQPFLVINYIIALIGLFPSHG